MYSGREMILILSGGIGSGKSVAAGMLSEMYGFPVYCADARLKELYDEHPTLLGDIENVLGCCLRDDDGRFMPSVLAREIFADGGVLEKVEALVFPVLMGDFEKWMKEHPSKVHVIESATVLEKDFFKGFGDFALVLEAPLGVRIGRAMKRDSASEEHIVARARKQKVMNDVGNLYMSCSIPFEVLINEGTIEDLRSKLADVMEKRGLTKML
jgi:dephospho-CoA kinase